jgi:hypothetical protein
VSSAAQLLWNGVRSPVGAVLVFVEPVIEAVCSLAMIIGVLTCVVFELSPAGPRFPLGTFLGVALSIGAIPIPYKGLLSLFV